MISKGEDSSKANWALHTVAQMVNHDEGNDFPTNSPYDQAHVNTTPLGDEQPLRQIHYRCQIRVVLLLNKDSW